MTGFPWNLIAYTFSEQQALLSLNSVIGTYGFNLFCISLFTFPALFILKRSKKNFGIFCFFISSIIIFNVYGFIYKENFSKADKKSYDYKIRVIGSNISLERFYSSLDPESVIQDLIEISKPNKSEKTIFVWPEGILPSISQDELIDYSWLIEKNFSENHFLIIGINSQSSNDESVDNFNSLSVYDSKLN